ncbi:CAAX protease self-immunity-domain containing protein [Nitzschia inconspicua]|uniref:CAAX protease self-immunity-domain containing protein n=1 Tax=Nitzschia inconspicua TaxID=303405 RepID=A0A9K3KPW8_9STRA|nr:CAAX protease self-immunity-domain containing protein [Nitzschia inconspicua]
MIGRISTFSFLLFSQSKCLALVNAPLSTRIQPVSISPRQSFAIHSSTPMYYRDDKDHVQDVSVANPEPNPEPLRQRHQRQLRVINKTSQEETSSISMNLIHSIWLNQVTLLIFATTMALTASFFAEHKLDLSHLHWNGMSEYHSLFDWKFSLLRMVEGVLFAIPMIAVGCMVENSDHRDASQVNFSTTNMVISLFGRRRSTLEPTASDATQVMMLSAAIALFTGISEELIFRGYIPTAIHSWSHSVPLAMVGQAVLFACGHLSTNARPGENRLVGLLQLFNGLWYGLTYLVTGGDLLPCIISHILYDCHILCETWTTINNQMDYTQESSRKVLPKNEQRAIRQIQEQAGPLLNTDTINFARRFFYAFDSTHKGTLSKKDTQRAVAYAFLNDKTIPDPKMVDDLFQKVQDCRSIHHHDNDSGIIASNERLDFSQFLQILMVLRSNTAR